MSQKISGVLPILHTPFLEDDSIDKDSLRKEIDWSFKVGADGVCTAMVSEILRLTPHERFELTELVIEATDGRGVVITSVGAESTKEALEYARHAENTGSSAIMAIPPVTKSLSDNELWEYFSTLANRTSFPLIVQDASSYVGKEISTEFYCRLLDEFGPEKIMFKPEASPIGSNLSALRDQSENRARIFDGSGGILLVDCYRRGISGTMPGVDLLDGIVALWNALKAGKDKLIYKLYFPICAIVALELQAGLDGFLAIEKYILVKRGLFQSDRRRKPYAWELDEETRLEIDRLLEILSNAVSDTK